MNLTELRTGDRAWAIPAAITARLVFWAMTQRVWEDALITITQARNAAQGLGLTHHVGEPLTQGFTSAISVLVPLVGEGIAPGLGLFALRIVSLFAALAAIVFADRLMTALDVSPWPRRFALAYLALDPLQVFYGMAGMETQIAVAIVLWSAWLSTERRPLQFGLSLGLALLVRPDFIIWVGVALAIAARREPRAALRSLLVSGAVVAPWLAFTTLYYGSPIPQTIIAKALVYAPDWTGSIPVVAYDQLVAHLDVLARTYAPFYENTLVAAAPIPWGLAVAIAGAVWLLVVVGALSQRRLAPSLGLFVLGYTLYRVLALPPVYFDWYTPPVAAVGVVLAARGLTRLRLPRVEEPLAAALSVAFAVPLVFTIGLERAVQVNIEDGVRARVGEYLAKVVTPGEPVALEPAGYIGYYSGATLYDYPGLTSPAALAAVRSISRPDRSVAAMMDVLRAPWIVVRSREFADLRQIDPELASSYELCMSFNGHLGGRIEWEGLELRMNDHYEVRHLGGC
jgi:hypothetical protein